ncbi:hypothetical protein K8I61_00285 [bacterium]|nr:hypothetical protein [bacterium]
MRTDRSPSAILALVVILLALPATKYAGSNAVSRFATTVRLVENGTAELGPYALMTADRTVAGDASYSDKAPGVSLLLVPFYALVRLAMRDFDAARHLTRLVAFVPIVLMGALYVFRRLKTLTGDDRLARSSAFVLLTAGSVAWPYHAMIYAHGLAAIAVAAGLAALLAYRRGDERPAATLALAGISFGGAIAMEYPAAVLGAIAGLYLISFERRPARVALFAALGAALPAAIILFYNAAVFGDPLRVSYEHVASEYYATAASRGLFGIGAPSLSGLALILLSPAKGLFFYSPVLIFGVVGIARLWRESARDALLLGGSFFAYALIFSGYFEAGGAASLGPRHLVPAIGALVIGAAYFVSKSNAAWRGAFCGAGLISGLVVAFGTMVEPQMPDRVANPLHEFARPMLKAGVGAGNILGLPVGAAVLLAMLLVAALWLFIAAHDRSAPRRALAGFAGAAVGFATFYLFMAPHLARTDPGILRQVMANHFSMHERYEDAVAAYGEAYAARRDPNILWYGARAAWRSGDEAALRGFLATLRREHPDYVPPGEVAAGKENPAESDAN